MEAVLHVKSEMFAIGSMLDALEDMAEELDFDALDCLCGDEEYDEEF